MKLRRDRVRLNRSLTALVVALLVSGCSTGKGGDAGVGTPQAPAGSQGSTSHNYVGTQGMDDSGRLQFGQLFGGTWTITLDQPDKYFSYQNVANEAAFATNTTSGNVSGSGFLSLTGTSGKTVGAAGYAVEVPGEAAVVRPGASNVAPVVSVITTGCPSLTKETTYQFISFGTPALKDANTHVAYGSVQASNAGAAWTFSNLKMSTFDGTALSPTALPTGNCGYTQLGYVVNIPSSKATGDLTVTTAISPSGYFVMDQGQGEPASAGLASFPATGPLGLVGVQQPATPIDTGSVVAAKYAGFEFNPIDVTLNRAGSLPVAFGQATGSGTVMTGGAFPNDDVTQTAPSNITLDLGQQDATSNGLYKKVTVTVPDTFSGCATTSFGGTDANGKPTCIFHGVAVVGNPNGKFVIFVTVNDVSLAISHYAADAALEFFLYQQ